MRLDDFNVSSIKTANINNPGRVRKRKESVKKVSEESVDSASSRCREMDREMIVLPRQSYLEMEQKLKILSESK